MLGSPSDVSAGLVKRELLSFLTFTGEGARRVEGRIKSPGDVNAGFAKRDKYLAR